VERDHAVVVGAALGLPLDALVGDLLDDLGVPLALDAPELGEDLQLGLPVLLHALQPVHVLGGVLELGPLVVGPLHGHGDVDRVHDRQPPGALAGLVVAAAEEAADGVLGLLRRAGDCAADAGRDGLGAAGALKLGLAEVRRGLRRRSAAAVLLDLLLGQLGRLLAQVLGGLLGACARLALEHVLRRLPSRGHNALEHSHGGVLPPRLQGVLGGVDRARGGLLGVVFVSGLKLLLGGLCGLAFRGVLADPLGVFGGRGHMTLLLRSRRRAPSVSLGLGRCPAVSRMAGGNVARGASTRRLAGISDLEFTVTASWRSLGRR
jgi:hypothetical protein